MLLAPCSYHCFCCVRLRRSWYCNPDQSMRQAQSMLNTEVRSCSDCSDRTHIVPQNAKTACSLA